MGTQQPQALGAPAAIKSEPMHGGYVSNAPSTEILSNLPLQMLLFFNLYVMLPLWLLATILSAVSTDDRPTTVVALIPIFALLELTRIYLGYAGNLLEKVPELAGFILATTFPQLPIAAFFAATGMGLAATVASVVYLMAFLIPEAVAAVVAAKGLVRAQSARFFLEAEGGGQ
ncbi:Transmembrane protein 17 [Geranomyces variabilis]|nr:Transmembrane protein 17 [Geranomyces variabilis]